MRGFLLFFGKSITVYCILFFSLCVWHAKGQHANIRIANVASSGGTWAIVNQVNTFTPTADNATISIVDFISKAANGNYSLAINTSRSGGTQPGTVLFDAAISILNQTNILQSLTINAGGDVSFNANLSMRQGTTYPDVSGYNLVLTTAGNVNLNASIVLSGADYLVSNSIVPVGSVNMTVGGNLVFNTTGSVFCKGFVNDSREGYRGGNGGTQRYTVSGFFTMAAGSVMNSSGGEGLTTAGSGNNITVTAVGAILLRGSVLSIGGSANTAGYGGSLSFTSSSSNVDFAGIMKSQGGGSNYYGNFAGPGGQITMSGAGGLRIDGDLQARYGPKGNPGVSGSIFLGDGNPVLTSGGGVNDGQVSGIISGDVITKSGAGIFALKGANAWTGSMLIDGGTVLLKESEAIPNLSNVEFRSINSTLDLNGYSETLGNISSELGYGKITSGLPGNVTLSLGNTTDAEFTGLIEDGVGVLSLVRKSTGKLNVKTTNNTYSGTTSIQSGKLAIAKNNSLGTSAGGTEVLVGASLELSGSITVDETLTLAGTGISNGGALVNASGNNTYVGLISVTNGVRINSAGGTLNLSGAQTLTATSVNSNLLFGGSGIVQVAGAMNLGTGGVTKDGIGSLYLLAANNYEGLTQVLNGAVRAGHANALGSTAAGVVVSNGASFELVGGIDVSGESLQLIGQGDANTGAFRNVSGINSWRSSIVFSGDASFGAASGTLRLLGDPAITASNFGMKIYGQSTGIVELVGLALYTGETELVSGSLLLGANDRIFDGSAVKFNGGNLSTAGYREVLGQIRLYAPSSISLGAGVHQLTFASAGVFDFKLLTIIGWEGLFANPGSSGTSGQVFVGTSKLISQDRLDQIRFFKTTTHYAIQLATGELVAGANITSSKGHSNVRIISGITSGGTWVLNGRLNTFTPSVDNATINVLDLTTNTNAGLYSILIQTNRVGGTQSGVVLVDAGISLVNSNVDLSTFSLNAGGDVLVNSAISLRASAGNLPGYDLSVTSGGSVSISTQIILNGIDFNSAKNIFAGGKVTMNVVGNVILSGTGAVLTKGAKHSVSNFNGSAGGNQAYTVGGRFEMALGSELNATGGDAFSNGGSGGYLTITSVGPILLRGSIRSMGGMGFLGGPGGSIEIKSTGGNVDYMGVLSSQGGGSTFQPNRGNYGGGINIFGFGGLTLGSDIDAGYLITVGQAGYYGDINLTTSNTVLTTGGGVNDGQIGGQLKCNNFVKSGGGVFAVKGANAWMGATYIVGGTLLLNQSESIPNASDVVFAGTGTTFDLNGYSETVGNIANYNEYGKITSRVAGNVTLSVGNPGESDFTGLIEDGAGVLSLVYKSYGRLKLRISTNTYSGSTLVSSGKLAVYKNGSLGSVLGGTTIQSGASLELNGVDLGEEPIRVTGTNSLAAMTGVNRISCVITLNGSATVYVETGASLTLNPTDSVAVSANNFNLETNVLGNLIVNGGIYLGTGALTKTSAGSLTLAGANVYGGVTTLSGGTTIIKNALALGTSVSGTTVASGALLTLDGGITVTNESLSLSGASVSIPALRSINGINTWTGPISMGGTSVYVNAESDLVMSGTINLNSVASVWGRAASTAGHIRLGGVISGAGSLEKNGLNDLVLSGSNTYAGFTKLSGGNLILGANDVLPDGSPFYFNGGTLDMSGYTDATGVVFISEVSTLRFGSGEHRVTFASSGTFTAAKLLRVTNWLGYFTSPVSRSNVSRSGVLKASGVDFVDLNGVIRSAGGVNQFGQIYFNGQAGSGGALYINERLLKTKLDFIKIINPVDNNARASTQLGTNEVVAGW